MKDKSTPKSSFKNIALLLQGGGALGAYQAGVFEALTEAKITPDWVAGISIGAVNAAIIAGNPPEKRLDKLREFWEAITIEDFPLLPPAFVGMLTRGTKQHQIVNMLSALRAVIFGIPGFFRPRWTMPWLPIPGSLEAISFYDTSPLQATLENLIDFDRINHDSVRLTLGAVNVMNGNFTSFDNQELKITPAHVMASGALPPGFPPVKIGDDYYWDGGLISNTPLQWLLGRRLEEDTLVFQVDLWSADGNFPQNMMDALTRQKDIRYSSRTRSNTDRFRELHHIRHALADVLDKIPHSAKDSPSTKLLRERAETKLFNIVHLIYHNKPYEGYAKDLEFSRLSMRAHWQAGYNDTLAALHHPEILQFPHNKEGVGIFDFSREEQLKKKTG